MQSPFQCSVFYSKNSYRILAWLAYLNMYSPILPIARLIITLFYYNTDPSKKPVCNTEVQVNITIGFKMNNSIKK